MTLVPSFPLLLLQIAFILGSCRLLTPFFSRLGQPAVVAEMTAGVLLGPSCLGWLLPGVSAFLFPEGSVPTLNLISQVGLVLFMFVVGWRLDVAHLTSIGRLALVTSLVSIVVPFALGTSAALITWHRYAPAGVESLPFALFMGTAMSITAFPVLVRILSDRQLLATSIGTLAVACAAFDDAVGWLILAAITAIVRAGSVSDAGLPLLGLVGYIFIMVGVVRPLLIAFIQKKGEGVGRAQTNLALILVTVVTSAYVTDLLGVHALFGAFFAGVITPKVVALERVFTDRIEPIATTLFLPLFFASSGLRTLIPLINGWDLVGETMFIVGVAVAGKGLGAAVAARVMGMPWTESWLLGVLLNTRGLVELVVLNIGLDLGILSPVLFSMMVVMAFATTIATSPLISLVFRLRRTS